MVSYRFYFFIPFEVVKTVNVGIHRKGSIVKVDPIEPTFQNPVYPVFYWIVEEIDPFQIPQFRIIH